MYCQHYPRSGTLHHTGGFQALTDLFALITNRWTGCMPIYHSWDGKKKNTCTCTCVQKKKFNYEDTILTSNSSRPPEIWTLIMRLKGGFFSSEYFIWSTVSFMSTHWHPCYFHQTFYPKNLLKFRVKWHGNLCVFRTYRHHMKIFWKEIHLQTDYEEDIEWTVLVKGFAHLMLWISCDPLSEGV